MEYLKALRALVVLCLAFAIVGSFYTAPVHTEKVFIGQASAINSENMTRNISNTIEEWIPFLIAMAFVGMALGYLGISMYRKYN